MAPTAARAILCGDPARALSIAQRLLREPRMSNHHRGLWGYFGETDGGFELTVQATGIGGPGSAIVLRELAERGARAVIRVGTCRCAGGEPEVGSTVAVSRVIAHDGASVAYGAEHGGAIEPDPELTAALARSTTASAELHSFDRLDPPARSLPAGALHDLQSGALLQAARAAGIAAAVGVVVSRNVTRPLEDGPLEAATERLAGDAAAALAELPTA